MDTGELRVYVGLISHISTTTTTTATDTETTTTTKNY